MPERVLDRAMKGCKHGRPVEAMGPHHHRWDMLASRFLQADNGVRYAGPHNATGV